MPAASGLAVALDDAYRAETGSLGTYQNVVTTIGALGPFPNIVTSEQQHVSTLARLLATYGLPVPAAGSAQASPSTLRLACQLGVTTEQSLVSLYTEKMPDVQAYPVVAKEFQNLLVASRDDHLVAFGRCA